MKLFKIFMVVAFVFALLLTIGCGQKEEAQPESSTPTVEPVEAVDSLAVDAVVDSIPEAAKPEGETSGH
ncbi:MAG: hypothetical protein KAR42_09315 [candidate division Zixibacteria bacterium]|nr:hypothetical protein [candidate division Zixibacteria bacterium]